MLYVNEFEYHAGNKFPEHIPLHSELTVQADGHELDMLYLAFPNLPRCGPRFRVVTFVGDDAKFILANLKGKDLLEYTRPL
jgi:hypothetical protein